MTFQIGECGAIPVLVTMLESAKNDEESLFGANCLWMLAFDDTNKRIMESNESCMALLRKLKDSENQEIQKRAAGALWEIKVDKNRHAKQGEAQIHFEWSQDDSV